MFATVREGYSYSNPRQGSERERNKPMSLRFLACFCSPPNMYKYVILVACIVSMIVIFQFAPCEKKRKTTSPCLCWSQSTILHFYYVGTALLQTVEAFRIPLCLVTRPPETFAYRPHKGKVHHQHQYCHRVFAGPPAWVVHLGRPPDQAGVAQDRRLVW